MRVGVFRQPRDNVVNEEVKGYLRVSAVMSAAFNFFINGMIAALEYRKTDFVPTNIVSIAIDLGVTCLMIFAITTPFCKSSLRQTKTIGILPAGGRVVRAGSRLYRRPVWFVVLMTLLFALILYVPTASIFLIVGVYEIPFWVYLVLKCVFCAAFGGFITVMELYAGMCKTEME